MALTLSEALDAYEKACHKYALSTHYGKHGDGRPELAKAAQRAARAEVRRAARALYGK